MVSLSENDRDRINAAIAEAERNTSGEIFCIMAQRTSTYVETPIAYGAIASLLVPLAVVAFGGEPWNWAGGWHVSAPRPEQAVFAYAVLQAAVLFATVALTAIRPIRLRLAPESLKRARVHKAALGQFLAKGLQQTAGRTGVLIMASTDERHAEIIADEGIYARVDKEVWADALTALIAGMKRGRPADGFVESVRLCGEVLAEHFPPSPENPNELPDMVVVI